MFVNRQSSIVNPERFDLERILNASQVKFASFRLSHSAKHG
jgi:hypothetical protein